MDVEKTMEFILQHQAKAEARAERAEAKAERAEAKAERQMTAIRKLIQTGMRLIVKNEESIKELAAAQKVTEKKLQDLAAAQKITETKLQGFLDGLRRGGNGRHAKN
jgi:hypothetical protein